MSVALIVSLNFHPGHVSHLRASYRQMEELGYESVFCVNEAFTDYFPADSRICVYEKAEVPQAAVAIFVFPSQRNVALIRSVKRRGTKIVYIFHEPLARLKIYREAGFSLSYLARLWLVNRISALTVRLSDVVLLPSRKAVELYSNNSLYRNDNYHYLPLLYDDERSPEIVNAQRRFFSYIGTVAADHSFTEYLQFVEWAVRENRLPDLQFLIATKSEFDVPPALAESPRVVVRKGVPLSDEAINACYASSYAVWNAYVRTTQSGVLAKSFMFGTPAIVLRKNLSEFTEDGKEVVAIADNTSFAEIEAAVLRIVESFPHFSDAARRRFEGTFYYRNYNGTVKEIIKSLFLEEKMIDV